MTDKNSNTLKIVCAAVPDLMSAAAVREIKDACRLYLQTSLHPLSKSIIAINGRFETMDDLYEHSEDFEELQLKIAERLIRNLPCTYVAMGQCGALLDALHDCAPEGLPPVVIPSVSLSQAAFPEKSVSLTCTASDLSVIPTGCPAITVEEMDGQLSAGKVKLFLSDFYPEDLPVECATIGEDGTYHRRSLPLYEIDRLTDTNASTVLYVPAVSFENKTRFDMEDLLYVIRRLRGRGGCAWDRKQTHTSLISELIEECYEAIDAIERDDPADMEEELGDVLMQVAFHAVIGEEREEYTCRDISTGIVEKLVRRHPHVFAGGEVPDWDAIKRDEKKQKGISQVLMEVPKSFPALLRCMKVLNRSGLLKNSKAEVQTRKITEYVQRYDLHKTNAEEAGEALMELCALCCRQGIDPELALNGAIDRFILRYADNFESFSTDG